eukprot:TRINITY_DN5066_c0_g1_i1.p1 TRINITY_DN5066_c0_g1~~TRINITY_DN5066_c0_g1_i1.p1  ORF type:complete len:184 (-),score=71.99 TRINITY_DN5066_c0_g1_i1:73-624(-)
MSDKNKRKSVEKPTEKSAEKSVEEIEPKQKKANSDNNNNNEATLEETNANKKDESKQKTKHFHLKWSFESHKTAWAIVSVPSNANFETVFEESIDKCFGFDDFGHLYAANVNGKKLKSSLDPSSKGKEETLESLNLQKGQSFGIHFDFGADWMFRVEVVDETVEEGEELKIVKKSKGKIPSQY